MFPLHMPICGKYQHGRRKIKSCSKRTQERLPKWTDSWKRWSWSTRLRRSFSYALVLIHGGQVTDVSTYHPTSSSELL
uniref:Uncharacterized protein n=1 Tax=Anguilla anguilla TaxID=7936 RepID=A0A0E9S8G5_ANGAN